MKPLQPCNKELISTKDFISNKILNLEIVNELERTEEQEQKLERNKMLYKGYTNTFDLTKFSIVAMNVTYNDQNHLAKKIIKFASHTKPRNLNMKKEKIYILHNTMALQGK